MWYYVTVNEICIGMFNSIKDVNRFLAHNQYTVIKLEQTREFETIIKVTYF